MPTAAPQLGDLALLTVNDGTASADQAFAFPISIDVPGGQVGKVEYSYMGQSARGKHFAPSRLYDNGEMKFSTYLVKADWTRLVALKGVAKTWKVTHPDDGTGTPPVDSFSGFLSDFSTKFEIGGMCKVDGTVTIDGDITSA